MTLPVPPTCNATCSGLDGTLGTVSETAEPGLVDMRRYKNDRVEEPPARHLAILIEPDPLVGRAAICEELALCSYDSLDFIVAPQRCTRQSARSGFPPVPAAGW